MHDAKFPLDDNARSNEQCEKRYQMNSLIPGVRGDGDPSPGCHRNVEDRDVLSRHSQRCMPGVQECCNTHRRCTCIEAQVLDCVGDSIPCNGVIEHCKEDRACDESTTCYTEPMASNDGPRSVPSGKVPPKHSKRDNPECELEHHKENVEHPFCNCMPAALLRACSKQDKECKRNADV